MAQPDFAGIADRVFVGFMAPLVIGAMPVVTHSTKWLASAYSGSTVPRRGEEMSPVRYDSWNSPNVSGSL